MNALRAVLYEFGQTVPQGIVHIKRLEAVITDDAIDLPDIVREECRALLAQIDAKTNRIEALAFATWQLTKPESGCVSSPWGMAVVIRGLGHRSEKLPKADSLRSDCSPTRSASNGRSKARRWCGTIPRVRHAAGSWHHERRIVARIEASEHGLDIRYVVTSLGIGSAQWIYDSLYCQRGQAENLIKLHKSQLASDRTSCRSALANQVRLVLHTAAYWLVLVVRDRIPKPRDLATAEFATIRLRLLKIAARIVETTSRIRLAFAAACPRGRPVPRPCQRILLSTAVTNGAADAPFIPIAPQTRSPRSTQTAENSATLTRDPTPGTQMWHSSRWHIVNKTG